jgi:hypothetical protein
VGSKTIVGTLALLTLAAEACACAAGAEDLIKPGKWEISTLSPGLTHLPPGMQLRPEQRLGPEGLTQVFTKCISTKNPPFPPEAPSANSPCKLEKSELTGDTATWTVNCSSSSGSTFNVEGTAHYYGDTLDGKDTTTIRTPSPFGYSLMVMSHSITGRYVGPCDTE